MKRSLLRLPAGLLAAAAFALTTFPAAGATAADPQREIVLEVVARTADGEPLLNVLFATREAEAAAGGLTGEDGRDEVRINAPASLKTLRVRPFGFRRVQGRDLDQRRVEELVNYGAELRRRYFFDRELTVELEPDRDRYRVEIVAHPAITVTGEVVDASGAPVAAMVYGPGLGSVASTRPPRQFELHGVRRGRAATLYALELPDGRIAARDLTAEQTTSDRSIDPIALPSTPEGESVFIRLLNNPRLVEEGVRTAPGVTLVSADGSRMYAFRAGRSADPADLPLHRGMVSLPAGDYYAAPGFFMNTEEQARLLEAARQGEERTLAGVLLVRVREGVRNELLIDLAEAHNALAD